MGKPKKPKVLKALIVRMGHIEYEEREAALATIVKEGPYVLPLLVRAFRHKDIEIVQRAKKAVRVIIAQAINAKELSVKDANTIGSLGILGIHGLVQGGFNKKRGAVSPRALKFVAAFKATDLLDLLKRYKKRQGYRMVIIAALGRKRSRKALDPLVKILKARKETDLIRITAMSALLKIKDPKVVTILVELIEGSYSFTVLLLMTQVYGSNNRQLEKALIIAFSKKKNRKLLESILAMKPFTFMGNSSVARNVLIHLALNHSAVKIRKASVAQLGTQRGGKVLKALKQILRNDKSKLVKDEVEKQLVWFRFRETVKRIRALNKKDIKNWRKALKGKGLLDIPGLPVRKTKKPKKSGKRKGR